ncbi:MAG: hypothetical protein GX939_04190 [Clostridiaceae bacterium]|nr:hypothetical protein [Clostridiaceae bacterium]
MIKTVKTSPCVMPTSTRKIAKTNTIKRNHDGIARLLGALEDVFSTRDPALLSSQRLSGALEDVLLARNPALSPSERLSGAPKEAFCFVEDVFMREASLHALYCFFATIFESIDVL